MNIVPICEKDFRQFWPEFEAIIQAQETYAYEPNMTYQEAYTLWCEAPQVCFVRFQPLSSLLQSHDM